MNKKIRKFISKSLVAAILFFNMSTYSLATILLDDTRYETFEGENVTIDNILEEDNIDIEVEGNTLVNVVCEQPEIKIPSTYNDCNSYVTLIKELHNNTYSLVITVDKDIKNFCIGAGRNNVLKFSLKANETTIIPFDLTKTGSTSCLNTLVNEYRLYLFNFGNTEDMGSIVGDIMILEGDWSNKKIPKYFEGISSVGETIENTANFQVLSENDIWVNKSFLRGYYLQVSTGNLIKDVSDKYCVTDFIEVKPNTKYTRNGINSICYSHVFYDENQNMISSVLATDFSQPFTFITPNNCKYIRFKFFLPIGEDINTIFLCTGDFYKCKKEQIELTEPLRGLSNGIKDRIIKKNGQWMIERNCGEVILDGTENGWNTSFTTSTTGKSTIFNFKPMSDNMILTTVNLISDRFGISKTYGYTDSIFTGETGINTILNYNGHLFVHVSNNIAKDVESLKNWLKNNPVKIIHPLSTPTYEPINFNPMPLYLEYTYLSNNSNVPANLKVVVDRVVNRAQEAVELAKLNPTIENLSIARMWVNLMKDSTLKDQMQDDVTNIIQVEDLEIERKKASANLDLYIKTKNTLSLSLDTNSITFGNYSGVEDVELLNAVNLTVNSSLPYSLNAYMEEGFYNSDKTNSLEVNSLNIRENTDTTYKQFTNIKEKLILKDDCDEGNAKYHTIDLKLNGNKAHKIDVFKTVIKFEIEQK